ncbi:MAG: rhomboid family intramembrane serine protease [Clostridia bacterium]|nr:rhomboid family intramembrane serine protease [Clostridia bacterium]
MRPRRRIVFNAPVVLGFTAVCAIAYVISLLTGGASNLAVFSVYRSSLLSPLTWVRFVGHVFGHASLQHLIGNMMYILLLGPMLEEKYGKAAIELLILVTAVVTGVIHFIFFPRVVLMGASGVVFAMILLASVTGHGDGEIPLTLILVALLYLGQQVYDMIAVQDNVSQLTHIIGGLVGGGAGLLISGGLKKKSPY